MHKVPGIKDFAVQHYCPFRFSCAALLAKHQNREIYHQPPSKVRDDPGAALAPLCAQKFRRSHLHHGGLRLSLLFCEQLRRPDHGVSRELDEAS